MLIIVLALYTLYTLYTCTLVLEFDGVTEARTGSNKYFYTTRGNTVHLLSTTLVGLLNFFFFFDQE